MHSEIVERAAARLRSAPHPSLPLSRLRRMLEDECGGPLDAGVLCERLRSRPDRFEVIEAEPLLWPADEWSADARRAYGRALREAGVVPEPVVALAVSARSAEAAGSREADVGTLLERLDVTLLALWAAVGEEPAARADAAQAVAEAWSVHEAFEASAVSSLPRTP